MTEITQTSAATTDIVDELYPVPAPIMKNVYNNSLGSCKFIFKDGTEAPFTGGHFYTSNPDQIAELDREIALGHPHITAGADGQVNTAAVDPLDLVRRAAAEEAIRRFQATLKTNDMGNTEFSGKVEGIGNSDTVGVAMAGSASGEGAQISGGIPDGSASGVTGTVTSTGDSNLNSALAALRAKTSS